VFLFALILVKLFQIFLPRSKDVGASIVEDDAADDVGSALLSFSELLAIKSVKASSPAIT
jgi:hypothetical protein